MLCGPMINAFERVKDKILSLDAANREIAKAEADANAKLKVLKDALERQRAKWSKLRGFSKRLNRSARKQLTLEMNRLDAEEMEKSKDWIDRITDPNNL